MPFARRNPGGVLPVALGMPIGLTLGMSLLRWRRRREIDTGGIAENPLQRFVLDQRRGEKEGMPRRMR
jgi:hypothetical protein